MEFPLRRMIMRLLAVVLTAILWMEPLQAFAQNQAESPLQETLTALQKQIAEMRIAMEEMKAEIIRTRAEEEELRQALQNSRNATQAVVSEAATFTEAPQAENPIQK